ncbi:MAG: right-handed parallel beta-helix repeat-containing protein [Woeseiaceae bacterium]|nr:right-handed parallel beta-helix repeat-containing protein [Woeseiaceae bacterium]
MKMSTYRFFIIGAFLFASIRVEASCVSAEDGDLFTDKDHPSASDSNVGSRERPFATIQKLVDSVQPGDCGFIRSSAEPYFEDVRKSGSNRGGITLDVSGTSGQRITISGFPGERPVIDVNRQLSSDGGKPMAGLLVRRASFVTIRNIEIRGARASGVLMYSSEDNEEIFVEDMHIHHVYGADNVGAVRLDRCNKCVVRNSVMHDIYDTRRTENDINDVPYGMHSGVHGYFPSESIIENNLIFNVDKGVYQKQSNEEELASHSVRFNIFRDVGSAYRLDVMGVGRPAGQSPAFHHNIIEDAGSAVTIRWKNAGTQGTDLLVYNNTLVDTDSLVAASNIRGVQVYNNAIVGSNSANSSGRVFSLEDPGEWVNQIAYMDYNHFSGDANQRWIFDRYLPSENEVTSIAGLRNLGFGQNSSSGEIRLSNSGDYSLEPAGAWDTAGRNGSPVGAVGQPVGPTSGAGLIRPAPPEQFRLSAL